MSATPSAAVDASRDDLVARRASAAARAAQPGWAATPIRRRLAVMRRTRRLVARSGDQLAATVDHPQRRSRVETISAEVLPLADALLFLERNAERLLRPRRLDGWGPLWLGGNRLEERREPLGTVLVIGPGNYPLFLPAVQTVQALAAGNAVLLKPGLGGRPAARALGRLLSRAGLPDHLLAVLPESKVAAQAAIAAGVDQVVFTGSAETGRSILADLAPRLTPAILELSGCDAVFVRRDADLDLTARALAFGLELNGGATCMAPRRVFVDRTLASDLEERLATRSDEMGEVSLPAETARQVTALVSRAVAGGARLAAGGLPASGRMRPMVVADARPDMELLAADLMAPVIALSPVADDEEALAAAARGPYALSAAIFSRRGGERLARQVRAGVVVINDLIAPTADPRLAFGGRGESGYGRTRGGAGLVALTELKTVVRRRTGLRPHLRPRGAGDERLLLSLLQLLHGGAGRWLAALAGLVAGGRRAHDDDNAAGKPAAGPRQSAKEGVSR